MKLTKIALSAAMAMSVFAGIPLTTTVFAAENWSYVKKKVQIKYALLMLSYPAKASALSSNAA